MSTLTKLNEAEVKSSDGYNVRYSRETLTYMEGDRYLIIPIEHLADPYEMVVYFGSVGSWLVKGRAKEDLSQTELRIVELRVQESLTFLKRNFSIQY